MGFRRSGVGIAQSAFFESIAGGNPYRDRFCSFDLVALNQAQKLEMRVEPITWDFGLFYDSSICYSKRTEYIVLIICGIYQSAGKPITTNNKTIKNRDRGDIERV
jgi:hypothetical protein